MISAPMVMNLGQERVEQHYTHTLEALNLPDGTASSNGEVAFRVKATWVRSTANCNRLTISLAVLRVHG